VRYYFFIVVACGLLATVGCGREAETGIRVDAAFRDLIPPDATVLAGVDLDRLKQTPLYEKYGSQLQQARLDDFRDRFGIDPRRDVAAVLLAANAKQRLALARGRFTLQQVQPKLVSMTTQRTVYKDHVLFGDPRNSLTFVKDGLIAAGPATALRDLLDRAENGRGGISQALSRRLSALPQNDSVWVVSEGGLPLAGAPLRQDLQSALSNIDGFVTGVTAGTAVDSGVHFKADFDCISDEGAQRVHDALRGGIGLARLTTNDNALDMLRLYDSIKVKKDGQHVHVNADLAGDLVDKVWAHLEQVMEHVNRALDKGQ
jgi:hypothetical protein